MSSKILSIALSLILLLIAVFSVGCRNNSKQKNLNNNNPEPNASLTLTNLDSTSIKRCIEQTDRIDTIFSTTECAETISYLNNAGITVVRKSIQHCMADTRMKWRVDSYFNDDSSSLDIFYDGAGNIVEVVRRSLPIVAKDKDSLRAEQEGQNIITIGTAMNDKDGAIIIADDKEVFYIDELGS